MVVDVAGAELHYARAEELWPYLGLVAAHGEMYVQFWLRRERRRWRCRLVMKGQIPDVLRQ